MNDIYVLLGRICCCKQLQLLFAFLNFKAKFIKFFGWQIHIQLFSVWQLHWEMKGNSTFQVLTSRRCRRHWKNIKTYRVSKFWTKSFWIRIWIKINFGSKLYGTCLPPIDHLMFLIWVVSFPSDIFVFFWNAYLIYSSFIPYQLDKSSLESFWLICGT